MEGFINILHKQPSTSLGTVQGVEGDCHHLFGDCLVVVMVDMISGRARKDGVACPAMSMTCVPLACT